MVPQSSKNQPKVSQRVPTGHHLRLFWTSRWKCENDGFVLTKTTSSWLEGSRGTSCAAPCAQCLPTCFSERLFSNFPWISLKVGPPGENPTKQLVHHFFDPAPLGIPWDAQGRSKTPEDTKMTPKLTKHDSRNDTKIIEKMNPKTTHKTKRKGCKHTSINRSVRARWRVCRRQSDTYTYTYAYAYTYTYTIYIYIYICIYIYMCIYFLLLPPMLSCTGSKKKIAKVGVTELYIHSTIRNMNDPLGAV